MTKRKQNIGVLILMIAVVVAAACGDPKNRVNGTYLSASMSDQEIIKVFGLDPATAKSKKVRRKGRHDDELFRRRTKGKHNAVNS